MGGKATLDYIRPGPLRPGSIYTRAREKSQKKISESHPSVAFRVALYPPLPFAILWRLNPCNCIAVDTQMRERKGVVFWPRVWVY